MSRSGGHGSFEEGARVGGRCLLRRMGRRSSRPALHIAGGGDGAESSLMADASSPYSVHTHKPRTYDCTALYTLYPNAVGSHPNYNGSSTTAVSADQKSVWRSPGAVSPCSSAPSTLPQRTFASQPNSLSDQPKHPAAPEARTETVEQEVSDQALLEAAQEVGEKVGSRRES